MDYVARKTINWTKRKSIAHECVEVGRLPIGTDEPEQIEVQIKLPKNEFQGSALVVIEAYRRQLSKRFECGKVRDIKVPNPLRLDVFGSDKLPSLRLLVVDNEGQPRGRLLGSIEKIQIPGSGNQNASKNSLLLVDFGNLENEIWKVDIDINTGPRLIVDHRVRDVRNRIGSDPELCGMILPSAFQQILMKIAEQCDDYEEEDSSEGWIGRWIEFCSNLGITDDPRDQETDKEKWIETSFNLFCEKHKFLQRLLKLQESNNQ